MEVKGDATYLPVGFDLEGELGDDGTVLGKRRQWWPGRAREKDRERSRWEEAERERPGRHGVLLPTREQAGSGGRAAWEAHGARAMAMMATVREERKRADRRGPHGRDLIFSRFPFSDF